MFTEVWALLKFAAWRIRITPLCVCVFTGQSSQLIETFPQIAEAELGEKGVVLWHCPLILSIDQNRLTKVLKSLSNDRKGLVSVAAAATTCSGDGSVDDSKTRL